MTALVENAVLQWEDGYARVQAARGAGTAHQRALARVVVAIEDELRKRLGSRFSVDELAAVYRDQADSLLDQAIATMPPDNQALTEASAACDAAFYLYMREAADFGGGASRPAPG